MGALTQVIQKFIKVCIHTK